MLRLNESTKEGVIAAVDYCRNSLLCILFSASSQIVHTRSPHPHVLPGFAQTCKAAHLSNACFCCSAPQGTAASLWRPHGRLPSHLITPQFPHHTSRAPSKSPTQPHRGKRSAHPTRLPGSSLTQSPELSPQRPSFAPKQELATQGTTRNHPATIQTGEKVTLQMKHSSHAHLVWKEKWVPI